MLHEKIIDKASQAAAVDKIDVEAVNSAKTRQPLYAARKKIYPKRATGDFRKWKWWIMLVTLGIYYITPWLRWDRGEHAPDQATLVDLANRRFYAFFIEIWPQEFYYVAGLLVMAGVGLFLVTSVVGRAWCGYTCPQTVWVDLFIAVERFFQGDRNARMKLDKQPWTFEKAVKLGATHLTWIVIAVLTGGAWVFYFADAPTLLHNLVTLQAPPVAYITIGVLTATTYVFGGIMREQVCTYMCPWPRIQAAMLDEDSLTVTYNDWRGEPRSHGRKKALAAGASVGDCVDCNACVAVCPMGIDIRDGQQLECITCALCIDACDDVMDKLGLERGLISYSTLRDYNHNMALAKGREGKINPALLRGSDGRFIDKVRHFNPKVFVRPRTLIYAGAWTLIGVTMLAFLMARDRLEVNVIHDRNPVYVTLSDGSIRNGFEVKLLNMIPEPRVINVSLDGLPGGTMTATGIDQPEGRMLTIPVEPDKVTALKVFVTVPKDLLVAGRTDFRFIVEDRQSNESDVYSASFEAPAK